MKEHNKQIRTQKLSKRKLTQQEYLLYEQIGMVDESQDWLELFTPARVNDLFVILHSCSDNQLKAKQIMKELKDVGFEALGEGTNILTMANPVYPGVCFKIALDDCGLADNYNDGVLEELVNEKLDKPRFNHVLAKHPSGIISVQERKVPVMDQDRMDRFRGSIIKTLTKLAEDFLIVDLSPTDYFLNYGVERNGDWCFIDASDLYPLENLPTKIRCTRLIKYDEKAKKSVRCCGRLRYTSDFSRIFCPECKGEFLPSELRPRDKEDKKDMKNVMLDGMTQEEREQMRREQTVRINGKVRTIMVDEPDVKPVLPSTDNPETVIVRNPVRNETTDQILGRFKRPEPEKKPEPVTPASMLTTVPKTEPDPDEVGPELKAALEETASEPEEQSDGFYQLKKVEVADEDEETVQKPEYNEPDPETVADLEPVSQNPEPAMDAEQPEGDEVDEVEYQRIRTQVTDETEPDDEDDEPHLISAMEDGPDASEDTGSEEEEDDEEIDILYSIITDEESPNYGINLTLVGDPLKALEKFCLPVFVWIGDNDYAQAINREQMINLIRPVVMDMLDDI